MKKILFLTIFILIFSWCSKSNDNSYESFLNKISTEYKKDKNFDSCMSKSINTCYESLITNKAKKVSDYKICEDLSNIELVNECKKLIIIDKAKTENNPKLCDLLTTNIDFCYKQVINFLATTKLDSKYCDMYKSRITNSWTWITNISLQDLKICNDNIVMQNAINNKDISYCNKLEEKYMQELCKTNVYPANEILPPQPPVPPVNNAQIIK